MSAFIDEKLAITLFNLHDLIIIRNNVVPQEDINHLMECTNDPDTQQATILDDNAEGGKKDLGVRDTLWYPQSDELRVHLEQAISGCYFRYVQPRYQCTFKKYEPAQFLGYNPGGHYKKHNDGEHFNEKTRQWEKCMPLSKVYHPHVFSTHFCLPSSYMTGNQEQTMQNDGLSE